MEKYNLVNKFGREFNNAFILLFYTLQLFKMLTDIHLKTPLIEKLLQVSNGKNLFSQFPTVKFSLPSY